MSLVVLPVPLSIITCRRLSSHTTSAQGECKPVPIFECERLPAVGVLSCLRPKEAITYRQEQRVGMNFLPSPFSIWLYRMISW